jgi:very-short-patch-repair endonuclease
VRFRDATLRHLSGDDREQVRHDLGDLVALGGLRVRRGDSPWSRVAARSIDEVEPVVTTLDVTRSRLQGTREEVEALVQRAGLKSPIDLEGWRQVLELLDGVARTRAAFGEDIFSRDLSRLCYATGDRQWRARQRQPDGFWSRHVQRQQVQAMRTDGQRDRRILHKGLVEALAQRSQWQKLARGGGTPATLPGVGPALEGFRTLWNQLAAIARCAQIQEIERCALDEIAETLDKLDADKATLLRMPQLNQLVDRLEEMGLKELLDELVTRGSGPDEALQLFDRAWLTSVLDELYLRVPHLREFMGLQHSRTVDQFQEVDAEHFRRNANRVRYQVATKLRQARDSYPEQNRIVIDQANRKRGHMPLRKVVQKAPDVLLAAHPCWAMSPLVVSQVLPADRLFDVVIFDEASQIMPHDAMTSIMRGRQLVVAGDSKQLPPSTFFRRVLGGEELSDEDDEDQGGDLTLYDSILDRLRRTIIPHTFMLRWHYRSRDERLIAFSNQEIYRNELVTFPGVMETPPLTFEVVDGVAAPGQDGSAPQEIDRVVQLVLEHAEQHSDENLGVIALSQKHASRLEAALRTARASRPHLDEFFSEERGAGHRFFIKNLERVQGDERDTIIFSVGHAKAANGRLSMRFGPLNEEGGERRLNVAVTRARRRMIVVSSFTHWDMSHAESAKNRGPDLLRKFLEVADYGGDVTRSTRATGARLDGFEQSVHDALRAHGVEVIPQLGVSGYRIDFALPHRARPGQLVLAVETDGRNYHSAPSARDRDRLRQAHLEQLGWRFHRVWSTDWFRNPEQETLRIIQAWEEAMRQADEGAVQPSANRPIVSPPMSTPVRRSPRPSIPRYERIGDYAAHDLLTLCLWLLDDGLQIDRETRVAQAMKELGFQKRGKNIVERLNYAFDQAQAARDRGRN